MNQLYWIMMVFPLVDGDSKENKQESEERTQPTAEHDDNGDTDTTSKDKEDKKKMTVSKIIDALTKKFPLMPAANLRIKAEEITRSAGTEMWNKIILKISEVCFGSVMQYSVVLQRCDHMR